MSVKLEEIARRHGELRAEFSDTGVVGPNLYPLHLSEEKYELFVCTRFRGYRLVHQCFLSFYLETLSLGERVAAQLPDQLEWHWYRPLLVFGASIFSRTRAAEVLYLHGYPLDGYTLLRDLKDRAIYLAAILSDSTDLRAILGMEPVAADAETSDSWETGRRMAARRRKEQQRILRQFRARLPAPLAEDFRRWEERFDEEAHLSLQTFFVVGGDWFKGLRDLPAGPQQNDLSLSMYMNRSAEVAWCLTRTLPIFQPSREAFGSEWGRRWRLLEENLRFLVSSVGDEGKTIVQSLVASVDLKFPFDPQWSYRGRPSANT